MVCVTRHWIFVPFKLGFLPLRITRYFDSFESSLCAPNVLFLLFPPLAVEFSKVITKGATGTALGNH